MSKSVRFSRWLVSLSLLLGLTSCGLSEEDPAEEYLARLENVLDVKAVEPSPLVTAPSFPAPRELRTPAHSQEISIREFMSLRECDLHTVIAQRNSQLGKVAVASQRLFNDLEILETGPACLLKLEASDQTSLAKKLTTFLQDKQAELVASLWRAILGGPENAKFWSRRAAPDDYPNNLNYESVSNINALYEFVENVRGGRVKYSQSDTAIIERHLGLLRHGDGGRLLQEYADLVAALEQANRVIDERLMRPLCLNNKPTALASYFQNVVNTFFVSNVQSRAVALNRRYEQLMPAYAQLESALSLGAPQSYQAWAKRRDELMSKARQVTKSHATRIQQLFKQCGLSAGRPPS